MADLSSDQNSKARIVSENMADEEYEIDQGAPGGRVWAHCGILAFVIFTQIQDEVGNEHSDTPSAVLYGV